MGDPYTGFLFELLHKSQVRLKENVGWGNLVVVAFFLREAPVSDNLVVNFVIPWPHFRFALY